MDEAPARNYLETPERELLLQVDIVVQALAVGLRTEDDVADKSVFVFDAISERGVGPGAFGVISLIFESGAVDAVHFVRGKIELSEQRAVAGDVAVEIEFVVAVEIIEAGEAMLPSDWARRR